MCIPLHRRMLFLGGNFVSSLIWTLKSKKPKNFFYKNLGFFQPCYLPSAMSGSAS